MLRCTLWIVAIALGACASPRPATPVTVAAATPAPDLPPPDIERVELGADEYQLLRTADAPRLTVVGRALMPSRGRKYYVLWAQQPGSAMVLRTDPAGRQTESHYAIVPQRKAASPTASLEVPLGEWVTLPGEAATSLEGFSDSATSVYVLNRPDKVAVQGLHLGPSRMLVVRNDVPELVRVEVVPSTRRTTIQVECSIACVTTIDGAPVAVGQPVQVVAGEHQFSVRAGAEQIDRTLLIHAQRESLRITFGFGTPQSVVSKPF